MKQYSSRRDQCYRRPVLPVFLYDLSAASRLLPPVAILPEQFHSPPVSKHATRGEVALMRAVLEDAIDCFQKLGRPGDQNLAKDAERWFFADDHHWPFSFVNICAVLGLNAEYVRLGLQRWRRNPLARPTRILHDDVRSRKAEFQNADRYASGRIPR